MTSRVDVVADPAPAPSTRKKTWRSTSPRDRASLDDNAALEGRHAELGVVVILARARGGERAGVAALPRRKETGNQDLWTLGMRRIDPADDVVRADVVVHERDLLADVDRDLEGNHAGRRD